MPTKTKLKTSLKISVPSAVTFGILVVASMTVMGSLMASMAVSGMKLSESIRRDTEISVQRSSLITQSTEIANYMEEYRRLPDSVIIDGQTLTTAQYLYLATSLIKDIHNDHYQDIYSLTNLLSEPNDPYPDIDLFFQYPIRLRWGRPSVKMVAYGISTCSSLRLQNSLPHGLSSKVQEGFA